MNTLHARQQSERDLNCNKKYLAAPDHLQRTTHSGAQLCCICCVPCPPKPTFHTGCLSSVPTPNPNGVTDRPSTCVQRSAGAGCSQELCWVHLQLTHQLHDLCVSRGGGDSVEDRSQLVEAFRFPECHVIAGVVEHSNLPYHVFR